MKQGTVYQYRYNPSVIKNLLDACTRVFAVSSHDIKEGGRYGHLPSIRGLCCAYLKEFGLTYDNIGLALHMTRYNAMHHFKKHEGRMEFDPDYAVSWDALKEELNKG